MAWAAHFLRDLIGRGALFRGGLEAVRAASMLAEYSRLKSLYLGECRAGRHAPLLAAYRTGDLGQLLRQAAQTVALDGAR